MTNTSMKHGKGRPVGVLPIRYGTSLARTLRLIQGVDPELAQQIRQRVWEAQVAEKQARLLVARFRREARRSPILRFPARAVARPRKSA